MTEVVAADIGGTHARFAIAEVSGGRVVALHPEMVLATSAHASLRLAWEAFAAHSARPLPRAAAIAFAGPTRGDVLKMTNNPWVIHPRLLPEQLGIDRFTIVNDFGAVGFAVAQVGTDHFDHLCGPVAVPEEGVISVVGPGTGLGVAQVLRRGGMAHVIETEGGHVDFSPLDPIEDSILQLLRERYRRVSVERIVAGPGLVNIYESLGRIEGRPLSPISDRELWTLALGGSDALAAAALDRFCLCLGAVAGDLALAHGANAVVIAGGLGQRLAGTIASSGFSQRFLAKGRFEARMAAMPVKLITHPQPGLFGAAAAYAQEHAL